MQPRSPAHAAFGRAIRELREERGISQEAFALKCGIDRSHYGGIERGERNPSLGTVFKIADALGHTCKRRARPIPGPQLVATVHQQATVPLGKQLVACATAPPGSCTD